MPNLQRLVYDVSQWLQRDTRDFCVHEAVIKFRRRYTRLFLYINTEWGEG